jgi:hypothetical protein
MVSPVLEFKKMPNQSGNGIRRTQSGTKMLRYRTEMLDTEMLMPMPSCGTYIHISGMHTRKSSNIVASVVGMVRGGGGGGCERGLKTQA